MQLILITTTRPTLDPHADYQLSYVWLDSAGEPHAVNPPVHPASGHLKASVYNDPHDNGYNNVPDVCSLGTLVNPPSLEWKTLAGTAPFSGSSHSETGTPAGSGSTAGYDFPDSSGMAIDSDNFPDPTYYPWLFRITLTADGTKYSVDPEMIFGPGQGGGLPSGGGRS